MTTFVAITWNGIDEPKEGVKYEGGIVPNSKPLNYWYKPKASWKHKPRTKLPEKLKLSDLEDKAAISPPLRNLIESENAH
ncbi:MAG: hypothetical protein ACI80L_000284 [Pseudohongiellaceae bacterium]|jgi:hypothetical protein